MKKTVDEFMAGLEAERIDDTWRTAVPPLLYQPIKPIVKTVEVPLSKKTQKLRDRVFYQLGRYDSGIRDADSLWGKVQSDKIWKKEKNENR